MIKKTHIKIQRFFKFSIFFLILPLLIVSCKSPDGKFKLPGGDARKFPADPAKTPTERCFWAQNSPNKPIWPTLGKNNHLGGISVNH